MWYVQVRYEGIESGRMLKCRSRIYLREIQLFDGDEVEAISS